ncbi:MAG: hypothetical protein KGK11_13270 [Sphingomonadales bacterium]|nr:hypothetical protein [Sphingomonadales bacterium]
MSGASAPRPVLIGWQTLLADLSLILFMVTAAALAARPPAGRSDPPAPLAAGAPLAIWREGSARPFAAWLIDQQPDSRQQLTITVPYAPGGALDALRRAAPAVRAGEATGLAVRVIVEPAGRGDALGASLAYDRAPAVARVLHHDP